MLGLYKKKWLLDAHAGYAGSTELCCICFQIALLRTSVTVWMQNPTASLCLSHFGPPAVEHCSSSVVCVIAITDVM